MSVNKYLLVTDEDCNGDRHIKVLEGKTPHEAFENYFLNDWIGADNWDEIEWECVDDYKSMDMQLYPITGEPTKIDFKSFIEVHDTRTEAEKDPEYVEYERLKMKFEQY